MWNGLQQFKEQNFFQVSFSYLSSYSVYSFVWVIILIWGLPNHTFKKKLFCLIKHLFLFLVIEFNIVGKVHKNSPDNEGFCVERNSRPSEFLPIRTH